MVREQRVYPPIDADTRTAASHAYVTVGSAVPSPFLSCVIQRIQTSRAVHACSSCAVVRFGSNPKASIILLVRWNTLRRKGCVPHMWEKENGNRRG